MTVFLCLKAAGRAGTLSSLVIFGSQVVDKHLAYAGRGKTAVVEQVLHRHHTREITEQRDAVVRAVVG